MNGECYTNYSAGRLGEHTIDGISFGLDAGFVYSEAGLFYKLGTCIKKGAQRMSLKGMQKILAGKILETAAQRSKKAVAAELNSLLIKATIIRPTTANTFKATKHLFQKAILSKKGVAESANALTEFGLENGIKLPTNKVLEIAEKIFRDWL
ncbi:hypothetical protein pah_c184o003 [Parachlamydia acanthamoebae str. Hall's coccus]|nr:hypothetical protein pah_c184o003 [Parachlamydia acanthamoebae str. Hall's coccus]